MTDIAVIILQKDEALHIRRCLERLRPLEPRQVFVVDCFSTDGSDRIAAELGATVVQHAWPGLHSAQLNWAIDNLPIETTWVLRLDADEYLTPVTIEKLKAELPPMPGTVAGVSLELKRRFCGCEIRHATNGIRLLRIWRWGRGRIEERAMDEHVEVGGDVVALDGAFYDDNLNTMDWWREKHRGYAKREAADALAFARGEIHFKPSKESYYRMPRYLRAFIYFGIRYFLKGGFLDGYGGWMWNFWQGLWYRCLVDREIGRLRRKRLIPHATDLQRDSVG